MGRTPRIHTGLVGLHLVGDTYIIITPDFDVYEEELRIPNADLTAAHCGLDGLGSALPPGLNRREVYSFGPISAQQYQGLLAASHH